MRTINKIITETGLVGGGAQMGRPNVNHLPANYDGRIFDQAVPLDKGGYDQGGAYWGVGSSQLRVRYTKDLTFVEFYRQQRDGLRAAKDADFWTYTPIDERDVNKPILSNLSEIKQINALTVSKINVIFHDGGVMQAHAVDFLPNGLVNIHLINEQ